MQSLNILSDFDKFTLQRNKRFEDINSLYDRLTVELEHYAKLGVEINETQEEICERLEFARDELVSYALDLNIDGISDVKDLLNFWYKLAVLEKAEQDIVMADQLIIPVHSYFNAPVEMMSQFQS